MRSGTTSKELLNELKRSITTDPERAQLMVASIITDIPDQSLELLRRAAKGSQKRLDGLIGALLDRGDTGCDISDCFINDILGNPSHEARASTIQRLAFHPSRVRFSNALRRIASDRSDRDWSWAVGTLGALRDRGAIDVLMDHTTGLSTPFVLLQALVGLRCPEAALVFEPNLHHPDPRNRTFALWGLAALEYDVAIGALVQLLDHPDRREQGLFEPGQSWRAAQALADVMGWKYEWGDAQSFAALKKRAREKYPADFVKKCVLAIGNGRLTLDRPS